jgi:hypothetical protein
VFTDKVPQCRLLPSSRKKKVQEKIEQDDELRAEVEALQHNEA